MSEDVKIPLRWTHRETPLAARAVVAAGMAAKALGRRIAALDDAALEVLEAVANADHLVVLGEASVLPWVDGVTYLGRDEAAPDLLLPTALAPTVPARVLEASIRKLIARDVPVAVLPVPPRLIPCGTARAIDRARLATWLETA